MPEVLASKIIKINDLNKRIRDAGFKTARIVYENEVPAEEKEKIVFKAVMEYYMRSTKDRKYTFIDDVLSPTLGLTVKTVVWYRDDCVKVEYVSDGQVDNEDDV